MKKQKASLGNSSRITYREDSKTAWGYWRQKYLGLPEAETFEKAHP